MAVQPVQQKGCKIMFYRIDGEYDGEYAYALSIPQGNPRKELRAISSTICRRGGAQLFKYTSGARTCVLSSERTGTVKGCKNALLFDF